jgi:hypothetical protein
METAMHKFKHNSKTYEIPLFADIPMGVLRKSRKAKDELDMTFVIIEEMLGEESATMKVIDSMKAAEFQEFISGWTQGAGLGEA